MIKEIFDFLANAISSGFDSFIEGIESFSEKKDHSANASFGNPSKLISTSNKGWCVDGKRFLDMTTSRRNILVVAGSGRGKSQVQIFPTILNSASSMVINDNSGELSSCIPYLNSKGVNTMVLNLSKKTGVNLNPLDGCKGDVSMIRKISKTLMANSSKENDFFSLSAEDCLSLFIEFVLELESHQTANLSNVYKLILEYQGNSEVIEKLFADKASDAVWTKFKALAGNSEKTLKSITATALSALSWLGDNPELSEITSKTSFSFDEFRKKQTVLFIQYPVNDANFYAPMVSLVFQSFYRFAFASLPKEDDLDIMMVLDEFSTLIAGLPDYSNIISNSRKFKIPQCIVLQEESLLSPYKELKDNILGNCFVKIYYGGQDKKAFELEKLLGNYTYTDKETNQQKQRPLLYANEIREMDNEILVFPSGQKPLKLKTTPAYKQRSLRKRLEMKPTEEDLIEEQNNYSISYIDLEPYQQKTQQPND